MNAMHSSDSDSQIMVFTGNANPKLAQAVVEHLQLSLGVASVGSFSDGEVQVEIDGKRSWQGRFCDAADVCAHQ